MSTKDHPDWWKNVGGQNSQDSILERRSLIWNDNDIEDGVVPPHTHEGIDCIGKFFTRGMRGKIERVELYCTGDGAGTVDIVFTPAPCMGPLYTIQLTPAVGWAWQGVDFEQMWNYDSMFLHLCDIDPAITWGGDGVQPFDGHYTIDGGVTWVYANHRPFIRLIYSGETPGDVPVSGIINNIRIPNTSSEEEFAAKAVPQGVLTTVATVEGIGYCDLVIVHVWGAASAELTTVEFQCDGVRTFRWSFQRLNSWNFNDDTQPISLPLYQVDDDCVLMITKMWEFRRLFEVLCENAVAAQIVSVWTYPTLLR